jgi:hypothetical protein
MHHLRRTVLSRRTCLKGLGVALALPLLESMSWGATPGKAPAGEPVRLFFMHWRYGLTAPEFWPKDEKSYSPSGVLPPTLEPLRPLLNDCLLIGGMRNPKTNDVDFTKGGPSTHAVESACWLTGMPPLLNGGTVNIGISADQIAAQQIGQYTPLPSLELGIGKETLSGPGENGYSNAYYNTISYASATQPLPRETDARSVLNRLFSSRKSAPAKRGSGPAVDAGKFANAGGGTTAPGEKTLDQSMLDLVMGGTDDLRKNLGATDQHTLDNYLDGVRSLEKRIAAIERQQAEAARDAAGGKKVKTGKFSDPITVTPPKDGAPWAERFRVMADLMVLAFQTDVTRVCSLGNFGGHFPELGFTDDHHSLSHNDYREDKVKIAKLLQIDRLLIQQVAYVVQRMKDLKDGSGSLLDHSLLLFGSGMGEGAYHTTKDYPTIVAGGANGTVRQGRFIPQAKGNQGDLLMGMLARAGCTLGKPIGSGAQLSPDLA